LKLNSLLQASKVCYIKVVTDDLDSIGETRGKTYKRFPVILSKRVLNAYDWVLLNERFIVGSKFLAGEFLAFKGKLIETAIVKGGCGAVQTKPDMPTRLVFGCLNRLKDKLYCLLVGRKIRRESALVPDGG